MLTSTLTACHVSQSRPYFLVSATLFTPYLNDTRGTFSELFACGLLETYTNTLRATCHNLNGLRFSPSARLEGARAEHGAGARPPGHPRGPRGH